MFGPEIAVCTLQTLTAPIHRTTRHSALASLKPPTRALLDLNPLTRSVSAVMMGKGEPPWLATLPPPFFADHFNPLPMVIEAIGSVGAVKWCERGADSYQTLLDDAAVDIAGKNEGGFNSCVARFETVLRTFKDTHDRVRGAHALVESSLGGLTTRRRNIRQLSSRKTELAHTVRLLELIESLQGLPAQIADAIAGARLVSAVFLLNKLRDGLGSTDLLEVRGLSALQSIASARAQDIKRGICAAMHGAVYSRAGRGIEDRLAGAVPGTLRRLASAMARLDPRYLHTVESAFRNRLQTDVRALLLAAVRKAKAEHTDMHTEHTQSSSGRDSNSSSSRSSHGSTRKMGASASSPHHSTHGDARLQAFVEAACSALYAALCNHVVLRRALAVARRLTAPRKGRAGSVLAAAAVVGNNVGDAAKGERCGNGGQSTGQALALDTMPDTADEEWLENVWSTMENQLIAVLQQHFCDSAEAEEAFFREDTASENGSQDDDRGGLLVGVTSPGRDGPAWPFHGNSSNLSSAMGQDEWTSGLQFHIAESAPWQSSAAEFKQSLGRATVAAAAIATEAAAAAAAANDAHDASSVDPDMVGHEFKLCEPSPQLAMTVLPRVDILVRRISALFEAFAGGWPTLFAMQSLSGETDGLDDGLPIHLASALSTYMHSYVGSFYLRRLLQRVCEAGTGVLRASGAFDTTKHHAGLTVDVSVSAALRADEEWDGSLGGWMAGVVGVNSADFHSPNDVMPCDTPEAGLLTCVLQTHGLVVEYAGQIGWGTNAPTPPLWMGSDETIIRKAVCILSTPLDMLCATCEARLDNFDVSAEEGLHEDHVQSWLLESGFDPRLRGRSDVRSGNNHLTKMMAPSIPDIVKRALDRLPLRGGEHGGTSMPDFGTYSTMTSLASSMDWFVRTVVLTTLSEPDDANNEGSPGSPGSPGSLASGAPAGVVSEHAEKQMFLAPLHDAIFR